MAEEMTTKETIVVVVGTTGTKIAIPIDMGVETEMREGTTGEMIEGKTGVTEGKKGGMTEEMTEEVTEGRKDTDLTVAD